MLPFFVVSDPVSRGLSAGVKYINVMNKNNCRSRFETRLSAMSPVGRACSSTKKVKISLKIYVPVVQTLYKNYFGDYRFRRRFFTFLFDKTE
jgi:hypothetical protein